LFEIWFPTQLWVALEPIWITFHAPLINQSTVVSEPMVRPSIPPAPYIEGLFDNDGQMTCPFDATTTTVQVQTYMDEKLHLRGRKIK